MRNCPKCGTSYSDDLAYCPNDGTATTLVAPAGERVDPLIGSTIDGRYRIEARIGEGGMGVVYRASHTVLRKALAIKVMRGEQAHDVEVVQRFVQEAQSSSAIGHPNIIGISDFGTTPDGSVYFAMEYLEGCTLAKAMEQQTPLPRERALDVFIQMASALDAAHQRGIVHRDLKPDNVFLVQRKNEPEQVKILDFGIAKVKNAAAKITRTGMVFGTPHYMSPEQAAGQAVDHRSDIYSFGVILYQVFAGQLPFDAESYMGVMTKHMYDPPVPPSRIVPALEGRLEDMILMALAKKPEQRYQSMLELKADLERAARGEPLRASQAPPVAQHDTLGFSNDATVAAIGTAPSMGARSTAAATRSGPGARPSTSAASVPDDDPIALPKAKRPAWLVPAFAACAVTILLFVWLAPTREAELARLPGPASADGKVNVLAPLPRTPLPSKPDPVKPPLSRGEVRVLASPAIAELYVDGARVGIGDAMISRPSEGDLRVSVRANGYFEKEVLVSAHTADVLRIALEREPVREPAPQPKADKPKKASLEKVKPSAPAPAKPARPAPSLNDVVDPWQ